jgi:hypothetical protein
MHGQGLLHSEDVSKGFERLMEVVDDLALDVRGWVGGWVKWV